MPSQKQKPPPLSPAQVAQIIRGAVESWGTISPSRHFRRQGQERDFTMHDALKVLEEGTVAPTPEWNERTETWNYDIHGTDTEGDPLTVRVAIDDPRSITLVTAF